MTDSTQDAGDREASKRDPVQSENDFQEPLGKHEKLIVLSTFDTAIDANLFRNELANRGIRSRVANETASPLLGATIAGPSSAFWIEVLVLESDSQEALQIKQAWQEKRLNEASVEIPEWNCVCGETVDAGFAVCWNCESSYEPAD